MSAPAYSRSQSVLSQPRSQSTVDYVEDSEPEREVRRLKKKTRSTNTRGRVNSQSVIELSDSDSSQRHNTPAIPTHSLPTNPLLVIDVSDCSHNTPSSQAQVVGGVDGSPSEEQGQATDSTADDTLDESLPSIGRIIGLPRAVGGKPALDQAAPRELGKASSHNSGPAPLSSRHASGDSGDEEEGRLKLGRFAYAAPKQTRRTGSKSTSPPERSSRTPEVGAPALSKAKLPSHRFTLDFTDTQLSRILKCVSCELAWTTRKSVAQKMKHIQTCAKKNALSDDTIRTLIRKELDNLPPVASSSQLSAEPGPSVPETLLEDVLKDAQKKKHGRRPQVFQTVKSITETRDDILDKARLLLHETRNTAANDNPPAPPARPSPARSTGFEMPPLTQAFGASGVAARNARLDVHPADTTQAFGPSRLGVAKTSRIQAGIVRAGADIAAYSEVSPLTQVVSESPLGSSVANDGNNEDEGVPPSTQIFAPSKFTNATAATWRVVPANEEDPPWDEPISIHDTSEDDMGRSSPARPAFRHSSPSPNAKPPRLSSRPTSSVGNADRAVLSPSPPPRRSASSAGDNWVKPPDVGLGGAAEYHVSDYQYGCNEWNQDVWNDDGSAYLHYIPEDEGAGPSRPLAMPVESPPRRELAAVPEELSMPASGRPGVAAPPEPPAKRKRRKKVAVASEGSDAEAVGTGEKDISQEQLNAKLTQAVLNDETLHLRVLRYEPVHFDVFMKLATDLGIPAKRSGLKLKVRAFLDQKAIHFYGADPSKSRTRRVRHP